MKRISPWPLDRILLAATVLALAACGANEDQRSPSGDNASAKLIRKPPPGQHDLDASSLVSFAGPEFHRFVHREFIKDPINIRRPDSFGPNEVRFLVARLDGTDLILLYPFGGGFCGSGGCGLYVIEQTGNDFRIVGDTSVTMLPVKRLTTGNKGHPDLSIFSRGYGEPGRRTRLRYESGRYPPNASMPPAVTITDDGAAPIILDYPEGW
jgi:hypothetical protein